MVERRRSTVGRVYDLTLGAMVRLVYERMVRPILQLNDSPHSISLGITLGLFVGLTPTVGIQMVVVVIFGTLIRANRLAAVCVVWISNVFTVVPLYYLFYLTGIVLLGRESMTYAELSEIVAPSKDRSAWEYVTHIFDELGWPLWIGSLLIATVASVPTYFLCFRFFRRRALRLSAAAELSEAKQEVKTP